MYSRTVVALMSLAVALSSAVTNSAQGSVNDSILLAPLICEDEEHRYLDHYAVKFQANHTLHHHMQHVGENITELPDFLDATWMPGYMASFEDNVTLLHTIRLDPGVLAVECEQFLSSNLPVDSPPALDLLEIELNNTSKLEKRRYDLVTRRGANWGLQMITSTDYRLPTPIPNDGAYDHIYQAGSGVDIYVVDSGIYVEHSFFRGQASHFNGLKSTDRSPYVNEIMNDLRGHGTHVAGIAGAPLFAGVATAANLINVKTFDRNGICVRQRLITAFQDIIKSHNNKKANAETNGFRGSIINMSFGFFYHDQDLADILLEAQAAGINMFAASGNEGIDISHNATYPCNYPETLCIGYVDATYGLGSLSNYGDPVAMYAPGADIYSLGIDTPRSTALKTGTSMACAYASGTAAIMTSWRALVNARAGAWVMSNGVEGQVIGLPGLYRNFNLNTGIHSPHKYDNEPFVYGSKDPEKNIQTHAFTGNVYSNTAPPVVPNYTYDPSDDSIATVAQEESVVTPDATQTSDGTFQPTGIDFATAEPTPNSNNPTATAEPTPNSNGPTATAEPTPNSNGPTQTTTALITARATSTEQ